MNGYKIEKDAHNWLRVTAPDGRTQDVGEESVLYRLLVGVMNAPDERAAVLEECFAVQPCTAADPKTDYEVGYLQGVLAYGKTLRALKTTPATQAKPLIGEAIVHGAAVACDRESGDFAKLKELIEMKQNLNETVPVCEDEDCGQDNFHPAHRRSTDRTQAEPKLYKRADGFTHQDERIPAVADRRKSAKSDMRAPTLRGDWPISNFGRRADDRARWVGGKVCDTPAHDGWTNFEATPTSQPAAEVLSWIEWFERGWGRHPNEWIRQTDTPCENATREAFIALLRELDKRRRGS